jgi:putative lipoic acid-binding regulatory protein
MKKPPNNTDDNNKLIKFPCDFSIKVVSNANFDLEDFTTKVVHQHIQEMEYIPTSTKKSSKGNYKAITITIKAQNQQQIDAIYTDLTANKNIIMVL